MRRNEPGPCKDCKPPKRYPGCHSVCEEGKAWEEKLKEEKERIQKIKAFNKLMDEHRIESCAKARRKRRK